MSHCALKPAPARERRLFSKEKTKAPFSDKRARGFAVLQHYRGSVFNFNAVVFGALQLSFVAQAVLEGQLFQAVFVKKGHDFVFYKVRSCSPILSVCVTGTIVTQNRRWRKEDFVKGKRQTCGGERPCRRDGRGANGVFHPAALRPCLPPAGSVLSDRFPKQTRVPYCLSPSKNALSGKRARTYAQAGP